MAGGGVAAAASAISIPWRSLLQRALDGNAHLKHSTFFQLVRPDPDPDAPATVGGGGRPANRTVVFRGFQEHSDKIQINTDARSSKIGEIRNCPFGEICWYFTDTWEQFRIGGLIEVIDGSSPDPVKLQLRESAWFGSSVKSRLQYLGPCPGLPIPDDDLVKDAHLDPSAGPVDAFCLLVLDPEKVDYLNLKSNQRLMFTRNQKGDESNNWMAEKISPNVNVVLAF
uniref:pyridoxal 5'-phosphate synthase n=1 Tax=Leersia perrieri TaxID=77586 RepID=A0A0D9VNN1_9ORYZ